MRRRSPVRVRSMTTTVSVTIDDPVEQLVARAKRLRHKGEERRAFQVLREACQLDEWRPRPHALLGSWLLDAGQREEAHQRLRHARWLCSRAGSEGRALAIDALLARRRAA